MTIEMNQFKQSATKGLLTLLENLNTFSVKIASGQGIILPGDPMVITDIASGQIIVQKATALTDNIFGFVALSVRDASYEAGDEIKIARDDCAMVMEASAAIASGARVQINFADSKVATAVAGNTVSGEALNKAAADGDLIAVLIKLVPPVIV